MEGFAPYWRARALTPSDTANLDSPTRALYVGGAGNASVVLQDGATVTLTGLLVGTIYPVRVKRVNLTGTTATNLVGLN